MQQPGTDTAVKALTARSWPGRKFSSAEARWGACVTVGDDTRADPGDLQAERRAVGSPPLLVADPAAGGTGLILFPRTDSLPAAWVGLVPAAGLESADVAALLAAARPCPLLPQQGEGWFGRPGLSGHRLGHGTGDPAAGRDWSPLFRPAQSERRAARDGRHRLLRPGRPGGLAAWPQTWLFLR